MADGRPATRRPPVALLAAAGLAAGLVLLPVAVTLVQAAGAGWGLVSALLGRGLVAALLLNTVLLVVSAGLACGLIGTAAAWAVERTDLPLRRVWAVLAVTPLAIPAFITSFAWVSLSPDLQDFWGALLVVTCAYYPLVYLPVAAVLQQMDPALEESARALGQTPGAVFRRVVLPQLRPALLGGMLIVALDVLVEFGAFSLLRFRTFTTEIYSAYRTGFLGAEPAVLAVILILLCLLCLAAEFLIRGRARYGRVGRGTRRDVARYSLGILRLPAAGLFLLASVVTIGVPLGMILYWLAQPTAAAITTSAATPAAVGAAALSSLALGAGGAAVTMAFALPLGILAARYDGWLVTALERAAYVAQSVPGIVVALALVSLTIHALHPLYQTPLLLLLAYAVVFMPLALVSVRAAILQAEARLEEAGRSLGLNWLSVTLRVTLPLAAPGLGAAAALVFIAVVTELTATLLLAPIGTQTLATQVWVNTSTLAFAGAAPYAAVMAAISVTASWALTRWAQPGRFGSASAYAAAPSPDGVPA